MKNEFVTLPRELVERIVKTCPFTLLELDYQELRAALADPVPPAGGDVEVLGYSVKGNRYAIRLTKAELLDLYEGYTGDALVELVDRAHVTRLKAEVERQKDSLDDACQMIIQNGRRANALQSELTKARECIAHVLGLLRADKSSHAQYAILQYQDFPKDQSAPADKGQDYPEGKRERFQKWVLATKHPVLGFLDGHWLARGDDREGYASEYVQGLWVAYKAFAAEQPAPVAVVMPERLAIQSHWPEWKISGSEGWNACLDELARLNPIKQ